jgi:putative aldouronate transport system permease protein
MVLPGLAALFLFSYLPMWGLLMAFMDYNPAANFFQNKWVGLKYFISFINDPYFFRIMRNTFLLGIYSIIFGFPAPIFLALLFNEIQNKYFKKIAQTISYLPHFISTVIIVGIMIEFSSLSQGKLNDIVQLFGGARVNFFDKPQWFRTFYIASGVWQSVGFGTILYLAAIAGINIELYEAAIIDGANRMRQAWHITIPGIRNTITILFIFSTGGILGSDFIKILLMYNPLTYETADVISTYVYRAGIEGGRFSYATAVGLFVSLISFVFLVTANRISKKIGEISLF